MIDTPKCFKRKCINFLGVKQLDNTETSEVVYCLAYPAGIPNDIAYEDDLHLQVRGDQNNDIVFEEE